MNKNKVIVGVVIIVAVAVVLYGTTQRYTSGGKIEATLIIENGGIIECDAEIAAGSNVFDLMNACGVPFEEEGGFVTSINGISQDTKAGKYWLYYVNGEFAQVGAGEYIVQDGDEITWKLEKV